MKIKEKITDTWTEIKDGVTSVPKNAKAKIEATKALKKQNYSASHYEHCILHGINNSIGLLQADSYKALSPDMKKLARTIVHDECHKKKSWGVWQVRGLIKNVTTRLETEVGIKSKDEGVISVFKKILSFGGSED